MHAYLHNIHILSTEKHRIRKLYTCSTRVLNSIHRTHIRMKILWYVRKLKLVFFKYIITCYVHKLRTYTFGIRIFFYGEYNKFGSNYCQYFHRTRIFLSCYFPRCEYNRIRRKTCFSRRIKNTLLQMRYDIPRTRCFQCSTFADRVCRGLNTCVQPISSIHNPTQRHNSWTISSQISIYYMVNPRIAHAILNRVRFNDYGTE